MKNVFTFAGLAFCACSGSSSTPIDATATGDSGAAVDARALDARVTCPIPQFAQPLTLDSAETPTGVALGDLNGDGLLDIALVHDTSQVLSIYLNTGNFSFAPRTDYALLLPSPDVAIGDLNGDGNNDVLTASYFGGLSVFPGSANATLGQRVELPLPLQAPMYHPVVLDLNGDTKMDIVGASTTGVMVLRAKVTAGFEAPVTYPGPAGQVRIGDFNGDGKQDVASLGINNKGQAPQVGLYLSNGNGTLTAGATVTNGGLSARDFAVADLNHDHKDDVIVSSFMGIEASISNGDGTLKSPIITSTKYYGSIAAGDIDLDGEPDAAVGYNDMGMSYEFARGIGNGVFDTTVVVGSNGSAGNIQFVDIDKDGRLDVFVIDRRELTSAFINIYRNICGG